jgi:hypothetical protein
MPLVKSMILCDELLLSQQSDKVHLLGVFNTIRPLHEPLYPYRHGVFSVFLQLSDADGNFEAKIVVSEASSGLEVAVGQFHTIEFLDRLQLKHVRFRLRDCLFPRPGLYWVGLEVEGDVLCEQRLMLGRRRSGKSSQSGRHRYR